MKCQDSEAQSDWCESYTQERDAAIRPDREVSQRSLCKRERTIVCFITERTLKTTTTMMSLPIKHSFIGRDTIMRKRKEDSAGMLGQGVIRASHSPWAPLELKEGMVAGDLDYLH